MITRHTQNGKLRKEEGICVKLILLLVLSVFLAGLIVVSVPTVNQESKLSPQLTEKSLLLQSDEVNLPQPSALAVLAEQAAIVAESESKYEQFDNKYDQMLYELCVDNDLEQHYITVIAISRLETGHYKSDVFKQCNNFGGMYYVDHFMKFSTKQEGAEAFVLMLKEGYIDKGLDTVEKMQGKYCPDNGDWATLVNKVSRDIS